MGSPTAADSFPGTSRFRPLAVLGHGATGVVYRALDVETGAEIALKTLARVTPAALSGLKAEFRALRDVRHRNLVRLHELVVDDATCFFTMELIDGTPLVEWVRPNGRLELERVWDVIRELTHGLAALHAAGKLHRDVKPSNVLVARDARPVILDFGLALALRPSLAGAEPRTLAGTLPYMAPEQIWGRDVGPAADWYGLGAVVWELVAERPPFAGSPVAIQRDKERGPVARLRDVVAAVPDELDDLVAALLAPEPSSRPGGADILARLGTPVVRLPSHPPLVPLIGREADVARLTTIVDRVDDRHASIVCVTGPSGIGKTALVRSVLEALAARPDSIVLAGRCHPEESVPFKALDPLVDALRHVVSKLAATDRADLMPPDAAVLARLFPVLTDVVTDRQHDEGAARQELRQRGFTAFRELVRRLAERRNVVLWIDDAQWGDADSMALLQRVLRPPDPPPIVVVLSYRTSSTDPMPALDAIRVAGIEESDIHLTPLDRDASLRLAEAHCATIDVPADVAAGLTAQAGGSPFLIAELARHAASTRVTTERTALADIVETRLADLSASARLLFELACVAGGPVDRALLLDAAAVGELGRVPLGDLEVAHLVRSSLAGDRRRIEVYHDRIREELLAHLVDDHRRELHGRLADTLVQRADAIPEAVLPHLLGAGRRPEATRYAVRAAERADRALAFSHAAQLYATAFELLDPGEPARARVRLFRGEALVNAGRGADAADVFLAAARDTTGPDALDLRRRAAEQLLMSVHFEAGTAAFRDVLAESKMWHPSNPGRAAISVVSGLARLAFTSRGGTRTTRAEPDAARRAELCYSMSKSFLVFDPMTGAYHALSGLRAARRAGDPSGIARGLAVVGGAVLGPAGGAFARWGARLLEQARTTAVARDDPYLRGIVGVTDAQMSIFAGRWRAALEASTAATRLLREECRGVAWERNIGQMAAIRALEELGDMHAVLTQAEELAADGVARGDRYAEVTGLLYAAIAHVARGDVASARAYAARARSLWTLDGFHIQHFYALRVEAWCDLHAGDAERAVKRVEASWPAVRRSGLLRVPISRIDARLLRARANLALAAEDRRRRATLLGSVRRDARALARESRSDAAALASLLEAGVATIEGSKATAVDGLARAATRFDACDMALQSDHARYWHATLEGDPDASRTAAERIALRGVSPLAPWLAVQTPGLASAR